LWGWGDVGLFLGLVGFAEEVEGAEEGAGAGGLEASEAFAGLGVVEGAEVLVVLGVGGGGFVVLGGELVEAVGGFPEEFIEPGAGGLCVIIGGEGLEAAGGEAGLADEFFACGEFAPEFVEGVVVGGGDGVAGEEELGELGVIEGVERLVAEEADGLEFVGGLPGKALVEEGLQVGPLGEEPAAAGLGGFELVDEGGGVVGIVG
jgi:hypothetical protein